MNFKLELDTEAMIRLLVMFIIATAFIVVLGGKAC